MSKFLKIETTDEINLYFQSLINEIKDDLFHKVLTDKEIHIKKQLINNFQSAIDYSLRFRYSLKNLI